MKKIIVLIILILTSCAYKIKEPAAKSISFIESYPLDTTKIKYNGFYNKIQDTVVYANNYKYTLAKNSYCDLIVFNKNKNIYITGSLIEYKSALNCKYYEEEYKRYSKYEIKYPKFTIKNDSLYTYHSILITVSAGQRVPVYCNFRGFVKNRDTITDWKVTPPYPKDFTKSVIKWNADLFKPHTLYFVKTDAVKCLQMK